MVTSVAAALSHKRDCAHSLGPIYSGSGQRDENATVSVNETDHLPFQMDLLVHVVKNDAGQRDHSDYLVKRFQTQRDGNRAQRWILMCPVLSGDDLLIDSFPSNSYTTAGSYSDPQEEAAPGAGRR